MTDTKSEATASAGPRDITWYRERYAQERDRRLRTDGIDQYRLADAQHDDLGKDPWIAEPLAREPLEDEVDALVVGAGFSALLASVNLRKAGLGKVRMVDRASDVGGTWYWNRYPGVRCDVESYIYLPLLEETGYVPTEKYIPGNEIFEHCQRIARQFDLYKDACFQTTVTDVRWDAEANRWIVSTDQGDRIRARYVVISSAPLDQPRVPGIPGIETFKGHSFHTSRWDFDYTGGDTKGGLSGLAGKRVGIIGTGATSLQVIPELAESAEHVFVVQRTPVTVLWRGNKETDVEWFRNQKPGWQRERMRNFNLCCTGGETDQDLVGDAWTYLNGKLKGFMAKTEEGEAAADDISAELADYTTMEEIWTTIDAAVEDSEVAESLKPYYRINCKRPTFSDVYFSTFNRPNVTLLDTHGTGVERVTEKGLVVNGVEHEIDCLIFGTGFSMGTVITERMGFEIAGEGGVTLTQKWKDGVSSFHGYQSRGFPNLFFMGNNHVGVTANYTYCLTMQAEDIAYIAGAAEALGVHRIQPTAEAEKEWSDIIDRNRNTDFLAQCTPGNFNSEGGATNPHGHITNQYGPGPEAFFALMAEWRNSGDLEGMELS